MMKVLLLERGEVVCSISSASNDIPERRHQDETGRAVDFVSTTDTLLSVSLKREVVDVMDFTIRPKYSR
jgi:hypothetical protein